MNSKLRLGWPDYAQRKKTEAGNAVLCDPPLMFWPRPSPFSSVCRAAWL